MTTATETKHLQMVYTRFNGPTNTQGSKIVASVPLRRTKVNHPIDHALSTYENHEAAAWRALDRKFGSVQYALIGSGEAPNDNGMAFAFERIGTREI